MTDTVGIDTRTVTELLATYDVVCRTCHRTSFLHETWCAIGPRPAVTEHTTCEWCGEPELDELGPVEPETLMHAGCAAASERHERDRRGPSPFVVVGHTRVTGPCPCDCNRGGFCGGCGHAGCGGGR